MNNNLNQQKPIQIKVYEELANTNTYDTSIALCKSYISEIEAITQRRLITYFAAPVDKGNAYINDDDHSIGKLKLLRIVIGHLLSEILTGRTRRRYNKILNLSYYSRSF